MPFTSGDLQQAARLAGLELKAAECALFERDLGRILEFFQVLDEAEIDGVEPMHHVLDLSNVLREDRTRPSLPSGEVLARAPRSGEGLIIGPPALPPREGE